MLATTSRPASVKVVGTNGQISLGKQFAGQQVLIEEQEAGVWLVRAVTVIPDNERWLHKPAAAADLKKAVKWASANTASDVALDKTLKRLAHGKDKFDGIGPAGCEFSLELRTRRAWCAAAFRPQ